LLFYKKEKEEGDLYYYYDEIRRWDKIRLSMLYIRVINPMRVMPIISKREPIG
jgi:hypothetical protein